MHELAHEFTSKKISPWGGLKFFQQTYERSGVRGDLQSASLPKGLSNCAHRAIDLVEGFMVAAVLGAKRTAHTALLRHDQVITELFGWKRQLASQSTFSRFFNKFDIVGNDSLFVALMGKWWERIHIPKLTIDLDSTVITRYGEQEGAQVGYNPTKKGRASHHPLMAFCDELKMVVNGWMRPGDTNDAGDVESFIAQLLLILPAQRIGLLRGDAGFYGDPLFSKLEEEKIPYIIKGRLTPPLLEKIGRIKEWYHDDTVFKDAHYAEVRYKGKDWKRGRRVIVVRRPKKEDATSAPTLFEGESLHKDYRISVYFTSTDLSGSKVHSLYNHRAECENRIKELKYDYGMDGFAFKTMGATDAAFRFILLAYNIMALFKQKVMTGQGAHQLATIRFQCIAIGSYMVQSGRKRILKLSAEGKRRHFLEHFFDQVELLEPPFKFSIA